MAKKSRDKGSTSPIRPQIELGFQRVKSTYTVSEISQLFGLTARMIRRWTREGMIQPINSGNDAGGQGEQTAEPLYDFRALTLFRRIRELRASG
ncbi:MAG: MerR family transcriptional regulator, partial [Blastocatellia bacterium]